MSFRDSDRDSAPGAPLPKPYAFVPLPEGRVPTAPPAGHHRYKPDCYTGTLTAKIIARSPVHVASGLLEPTGNRQYPLVKGHFRTEGKLAIPGTSLKGCIRSIAEAISHSYVQITRSRDIPDDYRPPRVVGKISETLDMVQRIFGTLGYQGLVRFGDALLKEGKMAIVPSVQLFRPRPETTSTYFSNLRPRGRKFYMHGQLAKGDLPLEACEQNSHFEMKMEFENLSAGELGLVLTALGLGEPRLWPKLGGSKPACLGTIEIVDPLLLAYTGAEAYLTFDAAPQPLDIMPLVATARTERLVSSVQLVLLSEILRWPREERNCPEQSY